MTAELVPFSDEETRLLVNLEQQYEVWIEAERMLAALPYNLRWKTVQGKDYLYEIIDRTGNGKSRGPRSTETEMAFQRFQFDKTIVKNRRNESRSRLDETCRLYRALRLPMIPSEAAAILREADRRSLLGSHLLVIGTNAIPAYFIEAGGRIMNAPAETNDFDMAWAGSESEEDNPVWAMLKSVDGTYTVNTVRPFQARNAKAYEVELRVAPSKANTMGKRDQPKPAPLHEQEWLLRGRLVTRVVVARGATAARMTVPDPRWFALQKLWMSRQEKRTPPEAPEGCQARHGAPDSDQGLDAAVQDGLRIRGGGAGRIAPAIRRVEAAIRKVERAANLTLVKPPSCQCDADAGIVGE